MLLVVYPSLIRASTMGSGADRACQTTRGEKDWTWLGEGNGGLIREWGSVEDVGAGDGELIGEMARILGEGASRATARKKN